MTNYFIHYKKKLRCLSALSLITILINISVFPLQKSPIPTCVSLGSHCIFAWQFRQFELRPYSLPFDWTLSSDIKGIFKALETDFNNFFELENLKHTNFTQVKDTFYNMTYMHDFPYHTEKDKDGVNISLIDQDWKNHYPTIKAKYNRRIERFRNLRNSKEPIYFFRFSHTTKSDALKLKSLLENYFPKVPTILILVDNTEEYKTPWDIPTIFNLFYVAKAPNYFWKKEFFVELSQEINLKIPQAKNIDLKLNDFLMLLQSQNHY